MPDRRIFVSYTQADRAWAEWIAWQLKEAGYEVTIQAWDFAAGNDFTQEMNQALEGADHVVAVLSPSYELSVITIMDGALVTIVDGIDRRRMTG